MGDLILRHVHIEGRPVKKGHPLAFTIVKQPRTENDPQQKTPKRALL